MQNDIEILTLSLEELWNMYRKEAIINEIDFIKVRKGIVLKFDIIDYFQSFGVSIKSKKRIYKINGQSFNKNDVDTEMILRERIMKDFLMERFASQPLARARGVLA